MSEITTAKAMLALAEQVEKLTAEMMALKLFVAAIPGAPMHPQAIRNALNRRQKKPHNHRKVRSI
jgi:hypothetical protein